MYVWIGFQYFVLQFWQLCFYIFCFWIYIDKYKVGIFFQVNWYQCCFFVIEICYVFVVVGVGEIVVQFEGSGVIGVGNYVFGFVFVVQQLVVVVWVDVIEGVQNVVVVVDYNDIFVDDFLGNVIVWLGDFVVVGDVNLVIGEDVFFFVFKCLVVGIKMGWNGSGILWISVKVNWQGEVRV